MKFSEVLGSYSPKWQLPAETSSGLGQTCGDSSLDAVVATVPGITMVGVSTMFQDIIKGIGKGLQTKNALV